jgi:hypothetical protein
VPAIGQTFGIVQAEGGVLGSFSALTQPDGSPPARVSMRSTARTPSLWS